MAITPREFHGESNHVITGHRRADPAQNTQLYLCVQAIFDATTGGRREDLRIAGPLFVSKLLRPPLTTPDRQR
jgi:hypothetical protein